MTLNLEQFRLYNGQCESVGITVNKKLNKHVNKRYQIFLHINILEVKI